MTIRKAVLRSISSLEMPAEFNRRNFVPIDYTDSRRRAQPIEPGDASDAETKLALTARYTSSRLPPAVRRNRQVEFSDRAGKYVASRFGKRHADVLRAIEKLDMTPDFLERNFAFYQHEPINRSDGRMYAQFFGPALILS